jgi:hypothetical protein
MGFSRSGPEGRISRIQPKTQQVGPGAGKVTTHWAIGTDGAFNREPGQNQSGLRYMALRHQMVFS